jgi:hypothetical protein
VLRGGLKFIYVYTLSQALLNNLIKIMLYASLGSRGWGAPSFLLKKVGLHQHQVCELGESVVPFCGPLFRVI